MHPIVTRLPKYFTKNTGRGCRNSEWCPTVQHRFGCKYLQWSNSSTSPTSPPFSWVQGLRREGCHGPRRLTNDHKALTFDPDRIYQPASPAPSNEEGSAANGRGAQCLYCGCLINTEPDSWPCLSSFLTGLEGRVCVGPLQPPSPPAPPSRPLSPRPVRVHGTLSWASLPHLSQIV